MDLFITNIGLGNIESALALVDRALEVTPIAKDALNGPQPIELLARVTAHLGELDRAIEALQKLSGHSLRRLVRHQHPDDKALLRRDPMFDALRSDPRFQQLVAESSCLRNDSDGDYGWLLRSAERVWRHCMEHFRRVHFLRGPTTGLYLTKL